MNVDFFMIGPPLVSLFSGIAILIWPKLLNYIVAFFMIMFGLFGLAPIMFLPH